MDGESRLPLGLLVVFVLTGSLLGYAAAVASDQPAKADDDGVLFPPDRAVLLSGSFDVIHSHPLEPIEHCQICHALHGSTREGLLKAPPKLCADCHDA